MKRAAIYARVAHKNDNGEELEQQIGELREYCKEKGYDVIKLVAEYRVGRTISKDLLMVVADFRNVDIIVAKDKARICRNLPELIRFEELAKELDIEMEYMNE